MLPSNDWILISKQRNFIRKFWKPALTPCTDIANNLKNINVLQSIYQMEPYICHEGAGKIFPVLNYYFVHIFHECFIINTACSTILSDWMSFEERNWLQTINYHFNQYMDRIWICRNDDGSWKVFYIGMSRFFALLCMLRCKMTPKICGAFLFELSSFNTTFTFYDVLFRCELEQFWTNFFRTRSRNTK